MSESNNPQSESQLTPSEFVAEQYPPENPLALSAEEVEAKRKAEEEKKRMLEGQPLIEAACEIVREKYNQRFSTLWDIGDAISNVRGVSEQVEGKRWTNTDIAKRLKLDLTPQRVGMLADTAEFFAPALRKMGIDFKRYEVAREMNLASIVKRTPEQLATIIEASKKTSDVENSLKVEGLLNIVVTTDLQGRYVYGVKVKDVALDNSATAAVIALAVARIEAEERIANAKDISHVISRLEHYAPSPEILKASLEALRRTLMRQKRMEDVAKVNAVLAPLPIGGQQAIGAPATEAVASE